MWLQIPGADELFLPILTQSARGSEGEKSSASKNLKGFGSVKQLANEKAYMLLIPMHLQISCLQDSLHI